LVLTDNAVPLATLPKLGYELTQRVHHRRVCGWNRTYLCDAQGNLLRRDFFRKAPRGVAWI
jgi:hypothetical protein